MGLIYYLFQAKGWAPGDYYNKPAGEKDLIWALASWECEQEKEQARAARLRGGRRR